MKKQKIDLIAEIGWNHMGNMNLAEKMIKAASQSGASYAKFQTWRVKNLKNGPWDNDGRREIYKKAELNEDNYLKLSKICKKNNIKFLTSLFNLNDYELIKKLRLKSIKIPSPENRNKKLLEFCKKKFDTIILSTGAASITEIKNSFKILQNKNTHLLHCVSAYPCEDKNVNIPRINKLKKITKKVGLSDHSPDILSSVISLPLGVTFIEKHFTVNNKLPGRDNKFAILPNEMKNLRRSVDRYIEMSKIKNKFIKEEVEVRKTYSGRWSKV
tara:strand:+ start:546 stop:1358 length:813 start_codon:yes stop_codon:yes gene_type:complete